MVATSDSKTIFTVNPGMFVYMSCTEGVHSPILYVIIKTMFCVIGLIDTQEAHSLYQYAQQCDFVEEPEEDTKLDPPCRYSTTK